MKARTLVCMAFLCWNAEEKAGFAQPLVPGVPVREADMAWSKEVWRVIDLREKINLPLYYPLEETSTRISLFDAIRKGIASGELTAYDPVPSAFAAGNEFSSPLSPADGARTLVREVTIQRQDTMTGEPAPATILEKINSQDIAQYWICEKWFFDRQRSVMDVQIEGIAPVVELQDDQGEFKGYKALFWLHFPDCRNYLAKYRSFNPYNDAECRTFDELFRKRLFGSYISMESNVYNRPVLSYARGTEALQESDRVKETIMNFEQDLWHY